MQKRYRKVLECIWCYVYYHCCFNCIYILSKDILLNTTVDRMWLLDDLDNMSNTAIGLKYILTTNFVETCWKIWKTFWNKQTKTRNKPSQKHCKICCFITHRDHTTNFIQVNICTLCKNLVKIFTLKGIQKSVCFWEKRTRSITVSWRSDDVQFNNEAHPVYIIWPAIVYLQECRLVELALDSGCLISTNCWSDACLIWPCDISWASVNHHRWLDKLSYSTRCLSTYCHAVVSITVVCFKKQNTIIALVQHITLV